MSNSTSFQCFSEEEIAQWSEDELNQHIIDLLYSMTPEQLRKAYEICKQEREKEKAHAESLKNHHTTTAQI